MKKRRYDLREFWPWYERSYPTSEQIPPGGGHATSPPFSLSDIAKERHGPVRGQRVLQLLCVVGAVALVAFILWGLLHEGR